MRCSVKTASFDIVPMTRDMLGEVLELEEICFGDPWSRESFTSSLENGAMSFFAAVSGDGNVLGYAGIAAVCDESELLNIAVSPTSRRLGIATALLTHALDTAWGKGCSVMYLEVRESNLSARALYEKTGFRPVGIRKNYYTSPRENAVIMEITP